MIDLDPFTIFAANAYPVGGFAKSKPPLISQVPLWGTVIFNDGTTFVVRWDILGERIEERYNLAEEVERHLQVELQAEHQIREVMTSAGIQG